MTPIIAWPTMLVKQKRHDRADGIGIVARKTGASEVTITVESPTAGSIQIVSVGAEG